jgi:hypothetical protein
MGLGRKLRGKVMAGVLAGKMRPGWYSVPMPNREKLVEL